MQMKYCAYSYLDEQMCIRDRCEGTDDLIISPGCDMPFDVPVENGIACYQAVTDYELSLIHIQMCIRDRYHLASEKQFLLYPKKKARRCNMAKRLKKLQKFLEDEKLDALLRCV